MCLALLFTSLLLSSISGGAHIQRRDVIAHDAVVGFPETVPSGTAGQLYLNYKPHLYVVNGCVPFPAVDAEGNVSGGLAPTGDPSGDCSSSTGQIYSRSAAYNGSFAIMYSWFWPKDSPSTGLGHRYDWEGIVVWLSAPSTDATLLGVAASAHGSYSTTRSPNLSGTSPLISYYSTWPLDHQLGFTSTVGGQQPLIAWESLTAAAQNTLNSFDFGSATVPFRDSSFQDNLAKAAL